MERTLVRGVQPTGSSGLALQSRLACKLGDAAVAGAFPMDARQGQCGCRECPVLKPWLFGVEVLAPVSLAVACTVMERVPASSSLVLASLVRSLDPSLWTRLRVGGVWRDASGARPW